VDAASPGLEMPAKIGGVGLARKIGFDLALTRLNYQKGTPLLISLDADTLTRPDYLPALTEHFRDVGANGSQSSVGTSRYGGNRLLPSCRTDTVVPTLIDRWPGGGAVIPFCHQPGSNPGEDQAISRYELFLRTYVLGLSLAGSPYAFHTVGSAMACTAEAYVRMGGMNRRGAGEDFYFLQHLAKTAGISQVKGTVVYPSARTSHRVPFGTGRSITDLLAQKDGAVLFYRVECFQILSRWLNLVEQTLHGDGKFILGQAEKISDHLADFLRGIEFEVCWERLRRNFRTPRTLLKGFHDWFDGLKTMKFIHFLSAGPYPRMDPEQAVPGLLEWAGLDKETKIEGQLQLLRKIQIGMDY
jgi:hypothetical protein